MTYNTRRIVMQFKSTVVEYSKIEDRLSNIKNVKLDDVYRVYFIIKEVHDPDLKLCYSSEVKNRVMTLYKGEYKNPDFKLEFKTRKEIYSYLMRTYGKDPQNTEAKAA